MAMRLFLLYAVVELAVLVALASTIGFGWTVLLVAGVFLVGLVLAGSQVRRHIRRLQSGLTAANAQGAVTDSVLVALGTVLVVIPGLASSALGALLLLPPTRKVARPLVTAMAARRAPLIVGVSTMGSAAAGARGQSPRQGRGDYIDGEVLDVTDVTDVTDATDATHVERPRLPE
ncbi:FxsA family protein [Mycolicibacterium hippocampi]|uniref:FxsA family protein n=1 Tax=Mycolicibacterium hippocampi TaxID=659824 RepID=UPI0013D6C2CD|nr:FxsA family protein [Mycolicibacterium hippocampi]